MDQARLPEWPTIASQNPGGSGIMRSLVHRRDLLRTYTMLVVAFGLAALPSCALPSKSAAADAKANEACNTAFHASDPGQSQADSMLKLNEATSAASQAAASDSKYSPLLSAAASYGVAAQALASQGSNDTTVSAFKSASDTLFNECCRVQKCEDAMKQYLKDHPGGG
jgi:hypothetical protein